MSGLNEAHQATLRTALQVVATALLAILCWMAYDSNDRLDYLGDRLSDVRMDIAAMKRDIQHLNEAIEEVKDERN